MILSDPFTRLLAGVAFGATAFVPATLLASPAATAGAAAPPPCTAGEEVPIPILGEDGAIVGVNCVPCTNLPAGIPGCPPPPECDPEVDECGDPEPEPDPDPQPEPDPDPEPGPPTPRPPVDPPISGRPTFTG